MAEDSMALIELMQKADGGDFLRSLAEAVLQLLMEADVDGLIGASRHERSAERVSYRNGYRDRSLDTRVGSLQLRIPKLRQGSYFPPFLEPRKTSERALVAVIQEAWIGGISTRRVDDLVQQRVEKLRQVTENPAIGRMEVKRWGLAVRVISRGRCIWPGMRFLGLVGTLFTIVSSRFSGKPASMVSPRSCASPSIPTRGVPPFRLAGILGCTSWGISRYALTE